MFRRLLLVEWSGLLAAILIGGAVLAVLVDRYRGLYAERRSVRQR